MPTTPTTEIWSPLQNITGECYLQNIAYDATNLLVDLYSFRTEQIISIIFHDVFSYRVTLEHFRWADFTNAPKTSATLIKVENSNYINWLENAGKNQLYDSSLSVAHYMLQTTEHIIDIALPSNAPITIDGAKLSGQQ